MSEDFSEQPGLTFCWTIIDMESWARKKDIVHGVDVAIVDK